MLMSLWVRQVYCFWWLLTLKVTCSGYYVIVPVVYAAFQRHMENSSSTSTALIHPQKEIQFSATVIFVNKKSNDLLQVMLVLIKFDIFQVIHHPLDSWCKMCCT